MEILRRPFRFKMFDFRFQISDCATWVGLQAADNRKSKIVNRPMEILRRPFGFKMFDFRFLISDCATWVGLQATGNCKSKIVNLKS